MREAIERYQPLVGLHGHIHESGGRFRIGRTQTFNPGSEYVQGVLQGVKLTLKGGSSRPTAHAGVPSGPATGPPPSPPPPPPPPPLPSGHPTRGMRRTVSLRGGRLVSYHARRAETRSILFGFA